MIPDWMWYTWVGIFAVLEVIAIVNRHEGDTLSELLRRVLGIFPQKQWKILGVGLTIAFVVWFGWHIAFQQNV